MDEILHSTLAAHGGVVGRAALSREGVRRGVVEAALESGDLVRVRKGIFADVQVDRQVLRAVRVGGALAGHSATRLIGLWQPPPEFGRSLVVSVKPHAAGLRHPDIIGRPLDATGLGVDVLYDGHRLDPVAERILVQPTSCIVQCIRHGPPEIGLAVLDSALRLPGPARPLLGDVRRRLAKRHHAVVDAADARAESGTESVLRWRFLGIGLVFEVQKWVTDRIRVDFLVAGFLVVECTSFEYHASAQQYRSDRERIAELVRLGCIVLEFTYHQVLFAWESVWAAISAALTRMN